MEINKHLLRIILTKDTAPNQEQPETRNPWGMCWKNTTTCLAPSHAAFCVLWWNGQGKKKMLKTNFHQKHYFI